MMHTFDPDSGTLAVTDQAFDALIAIRRESELHIHPSHLHHVRLLRDLGVLTDAGVHRVLLEGLSAVAAKQVELNIRVSTPTGTFVRQAWLLGDAVGWVAQISSGVEFRTGSVCRMPEVLAGLIGLEPRLDPITQASFPLSRRVFDAMLAGEELNRQQGAQMMARRASTVLSPWMDDVIEGDWRAWHFEMKWQDGQGRQGRAVIGVDTARGYLMAEPRDEMQVEVSTARPVEVWRRLLRMFPPASALEPRADRSRQARGQL